MFRELIKKKQQGVDVRFIFDQRCLMDSSCKHQAPRVKEAHDAGVGIRSIQPQGGCYACMHSKVMCCDSRVTFVGSVNMTKNGMTNNKEHLVRIEGSAFGKEMTAEFEKEWRTAKVVTKADIELMMAKWKVRLIKGQSTGQSASVEEKVVRRGNFRPCRTMSLEMDKTVNEEDPAKASQARTRAASAQK